MRNFLFHRVNPVRNVLWDPVDPLHFEKCIKYITKKYKVVSLEEYVLSAEIARPSDNIATILFDDGYKDNLEYAAPILAKYKCPASFYIVTGCIDQNIPTWTHILEFLFLETKIKEINIDSPVLPDFLRRGRWADEKQRLNYVKLLKPYLKGVTHLERESVLAQIQSSLTDVEMPKVMMSWKDVLELRAAGHRIGSHTVTHSMLGTIENASLVEEELLTSGRVIAEKLGSFPETISYPVGSYNARTIELSKKVGYKIGLAVKQTVYKPLQDDIYEVPRMELYNESWFKTKLRISNRLEEIKSLIGYKK